MTVIPFLFLISGLRTLIGAYRNDDSVHVKIIT
jgi:hypothetical protein